MFNIVSPPTLPESFLTSWFAAGQPLACTATLGCSSPVPDLELHEVLVSPFLQPVQAPLGGFPFLQCIDCTTQLGVVCKVTKGALDATDEDVGYLSL